MILRRKIYPKTVQDVLVTLFTVFIIPMVYYFELFVVLPKYYLQWSPWYNFHFILGNFIMFNVCSNYLGIVIADTSINGRILPSSSLISGAKKGRFCSVCECIAPPRSWHCNTCNVCILARDHHCMFTGCCIGHYNIRYFMMLIFYMFIATLYCSYYNAYFVLDFIEYNSWEAILKLIFPLATLFVKYSQNQMYLFLVLIVAFGSVFVGVLLYFHTTLIFSGRVTHERGKKTSEYDLGRMGNVRNALGVKWYKVWLSPFVESPLVRDGVNWGDDLRHSHKAK